MMYSILIFFGIDAIMLVAMIDAIRNHDALKVLPKKNDWTNLTPPINTPSENHNRHLNANVGNSKTTSQNKYRYKFRF